MAQNTTPNEAQILDFFMELPDAERLRIGDIETAEGYGKALDAYFASIAGEDLPTGEAKERKTREAREYSVLLLVQTGEHEAITHLIGTGLGSVGRESTEPTKWSDARKLRSKAEIRAAGLRKKGQSVHVLVLPTEEYLGKFLAA